MIRFLIGMAMVLATPADALAYCASYPDDATTGYVENNTARALCLQHELGQGASELADEARFDAALGTFELELQRQRQMMLVAPVSPSPWPAF